MFSKIFVWDFRLKFSSAIFVCFFRLLFSLRLLSEIGLGGTPTSFDSLFKYVKFSYSKIICFIMASLFLKSFQWYGKLTFEIELMKIYGLFFLRLWYRCMQTSCLREHWTSSSLVKPIVQPGIFTTQTWQGFMNKTIPKPSKGCKLKN